MATNKKKPSAKAIPMPSSERQSVRIEKIENGYLAHHSTDGPRGYSTKTVFHPDKPQLMVQTTTPKKTK